MLSTSRVYDGITFQPRDIALLKGLFESRVMTARHVAILYFDRRAEMTKKRLQKLKAAGFIGERRSKVNEPATLYLTRKAFTLLREEGLLNDYPKIESSSLEKRAYVSELTLRHELEIMDVKSAFYCALGGSSKFSIEEFSTWPVLSQFEARRPGRGGEEMRVKPDGFIRIHEIEPNGASEQCFFLEVDRSSEVLDTLVLKASCYLDYYRSGGFAVRNGGTRADFKQYYFRVLMVFNNAERRNNAAERFVQNIPPILNLTYLSTYAEVTDNPLGAIWIRPADYRKALENTEFDPQRRQPERIYRRKSGREMLVDRRLTKIHLLGDPPG